MSNSPAPENKAVNNLPSLADEDEGRLGPKMKVLTKRQRAFVVALLEQGDTNFMAAAGAAGYSAKSANSLRVAGHNLAHDTRIREAMHEVASQRLQSGLVMAASKLIEIAADAKAKDSDRLKAIGMIMNRAGMHEMSEHKVTVEHLGSDAEELKKITEELRSRGQDPAAFLKSFGLTITDAEYTVVEEKPFDPNEGLEDLI